ncbi:hypothetical protein, partial [Bacillus licheniformis]|uniref:hypothetical protein n=1 Tax=Bacillus licheniformis TaxID=1402 RepID=UPI00237D1531
MHKQQKLPKKQKNHHHMYGGDGGSRIDKFYIGLLISEMALYQVFYVYQFSLDKYKILIGSS